MLIWFVDCVGLRCWTCIGWFDFVGLWLFCIVVLLSGWCLCFLLTCCVFVLIVLCIVLDARSGVLCDCLLLCLLCVYYCCLLVLVIYVVWLLLGGLEVVC